MSKIIAIVAIGQQREIGTKGKLPWPQGSYLDDMKYFTRSTMGENKTGHPCIMTMPSYLSIPKDYRPLKGRSTIIVSRQLREALDLPTTVIVAKSETEAIHKARFLDGSNQIFICGGQHLYNWAIENADELWITEIPEEFPDADAFFPEFLSKGWNEFERSSSPNNQCTFVKYARHR